MDKESLKDVAHLWPLPVSQRPWKKSRIQQAERPQMATYVFPGGCKTDYGLNVVQPWSVVLRQVVGCEEASHCLGHAHGLEEAGLEWWVWLSVWRCGFSIPAIPYFWYLPWSDTAKRRSCQNLKPHCFGFHYLNPELNKLLFFITLASVRILSQQWQTD